MSKTDSATGIYFWPYDIFGYFLPGVVVLAPLTQFHTDVRAIVVARFQEASLVDIAVLCIAAYVLGHIVAAVSSWFFERAILKFSFGYPVTQQLCGYESGTWLRRTIGKGTVLHEHWPFTWFRNRFGFHWLYKLSRGFSQNCGPLFDVIPGFVHPYDDEYQGYRMNLCGFSCEITQ
ncbi:hypothetical protein GYB59_13815 [bacterium]|nr:hypothetical protein [bacterium]